MHTVIAGVGYPFLRDLSIGPVLVPQLQALNWPEHVEIEDWSFGPLALMQRLEDQAGYYKRMVFVAGVERGREPGLAYSYCWRHALVGPDEIQARIAEAIMGVISLESLLIICQHFGVLPRDVRVVEIEPVHTEWGVEFSPTVEAGLPDLIEHIRELALEPDA